MNKAGEKMKYRMLFFFFFSLILGFSIISQSRVTDGQQLYVSAKTISDYKTTIESEIEDTQRIKELVKAEKEKINEYEMLSGDGGELLQQKMLEELEYYKLISGNTDAVGEGVVIFIDDGTRALYEGEDPNAVLVHDMDILTILNEIKRSGAEVISVNGQRIVNETDISCSGYTIRINNQFFARPFEIKAIGDSKRMAASLIGPDGYGTILKDFGVIFKISIKEELKIPKYEEEQNYKYIKRANEEE